MEASPRSRDAIYLLTFAALFAPPAAAAQDDDLEIVADAPAGDAEEGTSDDLEVVVSEDTLSTPDDAEAGDVGSEPVADDTSALLAELRALRARVEVLEAERSTTSTTVVDETPAAAPVAPPATGGGFLSDIARGLTLSGWAQAQYEWSDLSEDEVLQGGIYLNRNRFVLRRGRIRLRGEWRYAELDLEIDVSTTRGLFAGVRRATIGAVLPDGSSDGPPLVRLRAGVTEIPFGHEVRLGQREMVFMERTTGSLALFRGPIDVGARLDGALGPFRYDLAVMGGTPLDDRVGAPTSDPTSAPDLSGRLGVEVAATPELTIAGGASFLWGTGFHAGTDATQNRVEWRDLNESGTLDTGELIGVPGRAATPSATFEHWAVGADLELSLTTAAGVTSLFGEVLLAENLDRSFYVADPVQLGTSVREVAAYVAVVQEILGWGIAGFRYDYYDPNSDLIDTRRGLAVPADASIHTLSPLVGVRIPDDLLPGFRARLVFQYDAILDALGRDARGVPADLRNDQLTIRVQGEM